MDPTALNYFKASSHKELIQYLKDNNAIKSDVVFNVMRSIDRKRFVTHRHKAYVDAPQVVKFNQTISAPHMHARILETLCDKFGSEKHALVIGSELGYFSAYMALALGEQSIIVDIESTKELQIIAEYNVTNYSANLKDKRILFVIDDGRSSFLCGAPYDIIYLGAATSEVPTTFADQLAPGGRLIMPIEENDNQSLIQIDKHFDGTIEKKTLHLMPFRNLQYITNSAKSLRDNNEDDTVLNKIIKSMLLILTEIEEKANNEHRKKQDQLQQLKTQLIKIEEIALEDKETTVIKMDVEVEKLKCKIEEMELEIDKMRQGAKINIDKLCLLE